MLESFAVSALDGTKCPSCEFPDFPLTSGGGKAALQLPSKGSLRSELASSSYSFCSYLSLSSLCFQCLLLYMPWVVRAQERNCCPLLSSWEVLYTIARAGMRLSKGGLTRVRGHVVTAGVRNRKASWKAAYKEKSMTLASWHIACTWFTTQSQNQSKKEIGSQALILQCSNP